MTSRATTQWAPIRGTLLLAVSLEPREIGKRIAAARDRKGWTQLKFSLEANVSPSSVQRWESGKLPPVRELMRIADVLGVDVNEFVEPDVDQPPNAHLEELLGRAIALLEEVLADRPPPEAQPEAASERQE